MARRKKKKKARLLYVKVFLWLFAVILLVFTAVNIFVVKPHIFYPGFEIPIPSGYRIHGIDVSRYQQVINWEEVKQMESKGLKIGFVFIKATEGITKVDNQFGRNWSKSKKHGIPRGAYHFYVPGRNAARQAENFMQMVHLEPGDLPPVLDIEVSGRLNVEQIRRDAKTWLQLVERKYGVLPVIYTNISFYERYFNEGFEKYPVWIAHYLQPDKPRTKRKWHFWQHSETGRVNGIKGMVDFNVFHGDSTQFRALLIK